MRGIENILNMRKNRIVPTVVFVEMRPMQHWVKQLTQKAGQFVDIHLDPDDIKKIDTADLRCLLGVSHVQVNGPDDESTEKVAQACRKAGAKVVEAFFFDESVMPQNPKSIVKAMRLTQAEVKTVWPK